MRVRFRILIFRGNEPLRKKSLSGKKDPLSTGLRYLLEFKYLEASKWLLLAPDSWEKYALLALINLALGQEEAAGDFFNQAGEYGRMTDLRIFIKSSGGLREVDIRTDPALLLSANGER